MGVKFLPVASSSKGNCTYIASDSTKILIDCGLSAKKATEVLNSHNIDISEVSAIFITHEHSDHINGIGVLARKYKIPIYATPKTWDSIIESGKLGKIDERLINNVYKEEKCIIDDIVVSAFGISHDAVDPVGYNVYLNDKKVTVCTDFGVVTDGLKEKLSNSNILLIESNHDIRMVETGSYPFPLKKRILGHRGHISNVSCAELLLSLDTEKIEHIFLGHLSEENNKPLLALDTVKNILRTNSFKDTVKIRLAENGPMKSVLEL